MSHVSASTSSEGTSEELLKGIEKRRQLREKEQHNIGWYFWLLSEHPLLVLILCFMLSLVLSVVGVVFTDYPDFSDPSKGFEVRGTELADKLVTWRNMLNETGYNSTLSNYPYHYMEKKALAIQRTNRKRSKPKRNRKGKRRKKKRRRARRSSDAYTWDFQSNGYFCENPDPYYAKWVYKLKDPNLPSLWTVPAMLSICRSEKRLLTHPTYPDLCLKKTDSTCCPTLSLPNYVAYFAGLDSCESITTKSLRKTENLLQTCAPFYCRGELTANCWKPADATSKCSKDIPKQCTKHNAVFTVFHYILTSDVACEEFSYLSAFNHSIQSTIALAPAFKGSTLTPLYYDNFAMTSQTSDDVTEVSGMDLGVQNDVFSDLLYADALYPAIAIGAVQLIILLYTGSVFVTISNFLLGASAMLIAYFIYYVVLNFAFFPFLNITAVLVMLGLSADNVLVFTSAWRHYSEEDKQKICPSQRFKTGDYPIRCRIGVVLKTAMKHIAWSLFVTGFTTAAAFFANYSSAVTAIKCFGMFTGLTILSNLFLSLTWLPASIVLHHKLFKFSYCPLPYDTKTTSCWMTSQCAKLCQTLSEMSRVFFHQIQVLLIVRFRFVWILFFLATAGASVYVTVFNPGLKLPNSKNYFQYFKSSHPFEVYASQEAQKFSFENDTTYLMPVRIVFGVRATDNGNHNDPDNLGSVTLRPRFNMSSTRSQRWLLKFCERIRNSSYYRPVPELESYTHCFIETFKHWMEAPCSSERPVCCETSKFPYRPHVFEECLKEAMNEITLQPGMMLNKYTPGPRFDRNDKLIGLIVEMPTTQPLSASFKEMDVFYTHLEQFLSPLLRSAPFGLASGWFIGDFQFYSLQKGLYDGTLTSVGLSLLVAQFVILVTSRNIAIALFANLSVACVIFVTAASLVLLGWELNVLESVTISIAVGLAVDFTAHYAIAYIVAPSSGDRQQRVEFAASRMGAAISMAALTTFIAGAGLLPSNVLAYNHFGVFIMLVMAASWLYSNYFFLPVLSAIGPQGSCCDLRCSSSCCTGIATDSDEHTTIMTETSSVKVTCATPASSRAPMLSSVSSNATEIIERQTVI
uniref:Protein dispatched homolog 1-like n=1 Tax=Phallusia mammillata TaxID=59560 RepID=A0A6F9DAV7_9ASCI|nr:protein dispatched homolog 1-like [Phallusia mammillata]